MLLMSGEQGPGILPYVLRCMGPPPPAAKGDPAPNVRSARSETSWSELV